LNFYSRQEIDEFHIILQTQHVDKERVDEAQKILLEYGIEPKSIWRGEYTASLLQNYVHRALENLGRYDWMILADLDEFHNFPIPAGRLLKNCDEQGINCVTGRLLDRVAQGGKLKFIEKETRIDSQFPHASYLTNHIGGGNTTKIIALKSPLIPSLGHHSIRRKRKKAEYLSTPIDVFHFKWDSVVIERLAKRYEDYSRKNIRWSKESLRLYEYLTKNERILAADYSPEEGKPLIYHGYI
jgi:hypothetical protein